MYVLPVQDNNKENQDDVINSDDAGGRKRKAPIRNMHIVALVADEIRRFVNQRFPFPDFRSGPTKIIDVNF
jgi:type IV secretory pathway VirD2 relaxase